MIIKDLFNYFSDFVPAAALGELFHASTGTAYDTFRAAAAARTSQRRIAQIQDFIFGIEAESLQKRISQVKGLFLFVEYSTITSSIDTVVDVKTDVMHVAVTVAAPQDTEQDQAAELLNQDNCLAILSTIRSAMRDDIDSDNVRWMRYPTSIQPFVAKALANSMGWTMEFDVAGVDIV